MFDVCCLGILVADVTVMPVNHLPKEGKLAIVDSISLGIGGCAANTATDLNKLGLHTAVIGKVGSDPFGSYICKDLDGSGIDVSGIRHSLTVPTSAAIVVINGRGERSFLHCPGTNGNFCAQDVDFSILENSKILYIGGALLMPDFDGQPTAQLLEKAKEMGLYTVLDTAWDARGRWMELVRPCLPYLDLFIPSIEEAEALSGKEYVSDMADVFLDRGVSLCVIKQGRKGCYIKSGNGDAFTIPCLDRVKAKDTNGAGDAFVAGFLTGISKGWDVQACGRFANAVGALCVSEVGTTSGILTLKDTLDFMDKYEKETVELG